MADVLVIGAGLAGARTCAELRAAGFAGRVTLVGDEQEPPYDRPPLTKDPGGEVDLRIVMALDVWAAADEVLLGLRVERLDAGESGLVVTCSDGSLVSADAVIVATGAAPVLPQDWALPGVRVLHTRAQARQLWDTVGPGTRVIIAGGGWIGCEAAATAATRGAHVELHEAGLQVLDGQLPGAVGTRVADWLVEAGVVVSLGSPVVGVSAGSQGVAVQVGGPAPGLAGPADVALVALGVRPSTQWLAGSGVVLGPSGAVLTDAWGRTNQPGVLAVGDAAARWSPRHRDHLPGGHWTAALNTPGVVAPVAAAWAADGGQGHDSDDRAVKWEGDPGLPADDPIPYVFSEMAGRTLQVLGRGAGAQHEGSRLVWRESGASWSAFELSAEGALLGVCAFGRPRDIGAARRAMLAHPRGTPKVDARLLSDPAVVDLGG